LPKKLVFSLIITLLLTSMLTLAFNACRVEAERSIYIMADGSIEGTTTIQTVDNITYLFLADINGSIVVERDYIVLDGAGHTLIGNGSESGTGINIVGSHPAPRTNVTVRNVQMTAFDIGINLHECTNCTISGNNITSNSNGVYLDWSPNNDISNNNITANNIGVRVNGNSFYNKIFHNNFIQNAAQVNFAYGGSTRDSVWDNGYPDGGNFWSDYNGTDLYSGQFQNESGSDGIGDSQYNILFLMQHMGEYYIVVGQDRYPLTIPLESNLPLAYPTADFTYAPIEPLAGQAVLFNASTSTCIDGTIRRFNWDFGDGKTDTGPTVSHVYEIQGNYNVTLTAISNTFIPDTKNQTIYVARVPAWQTWAVIGAAVTLMAVVAIILFLGLRRGRTKKPDKQT